MKKCKVLLLAFILVMAVSINVKAEIITDKSIKGVKVNFFEEKTDINIYEDIILYLNAAEDIDVKRVDLKSSNKSVFGFATTSINELETNNTPENRKIINFSLTPKKNGITNLTATFFDANNNKISSDIILVNVHNPEIMKDAMLVDDAYVPNAIEYNGYNIRKFSQYKNKNKAMSKLNSLYKKELTIVKKHFKLNTSKVTTDNIDTFLNCFSNIRSSQLNIIPISSYKKIDAALVTLNNNINNQKVDNTLENINVKNVMLRNASDANENEKEALLDIISILPTNTKINSLVEKSYSMTRGFGDPAANAYAAKYAYSPNKNYAYFSSGGDCTNFVSQIVRAGGRAMNKTWEYNVKLGAEKNYSSYAWKNAQGFKVYYKPAYTSTNLKNFSYNVFPGTAIIQDWHNDGSMNHAGWVTAANSFYKTYKDQYGKSRIYMNFKVAQHSRDYHLWISNNDNGWDQIEGDRYYVSYFQ